MSTELLLTREPQDGITADQPHTADPSTRPTRAARPLLGGAKPIEPTPSVASVVAAVATASIAAAIAVQFAANTWFVPISDRLADEFLLTDAVIRTLFAPLFFGAVASVVIGTAVYGWLDGPRAAMKGCALGVGAGTAQIVPIVGLLSALSKDGPAWLFSVAGYVAFQFVGQALWGAILGLGRGRAGAVKAALVFGFVGPLLGLCSGAGAQLVGLADRSGLMLVALAFGINVTVFALRALCLALVIRSTH